MSIDFSNLTERLAKRDEALNLADAVMKDTLFPDFISSEEISGGLVASHILGYVESNIDVIFRFSTSPIEKIFLSSVLLCAIRTGLLFLEMVTPIRTSIKKIDIARSNYLMSMQAWDIYRALTGERSMDDFLKFIHSGLQWFGIDIPESLRSQWSNEISMRIYDHYKTFFLCLKCNFSDILPAGKDAEVDIFVWNIYNPNFKLVIESDESDYHRNKSSFSDDRSRDRFLQSRGFQVLRFSGDEIINNPLGKAMELINYLEASR